MIGLNPLLLGTRRDRGSSECRIFHRQLLHSAMAKIFEPLKPAMSKPEIMKCADGNYRRVIYGFGPYIADYPEQCLIANIYQGWCSM